MKKNTRNSNVQKCTCLSLISLFLLSIPIPDRLSAQQQPTLENGIEIKEVMIPLDDGIKLATDLYFSQKGNSEERLPILLEYLPYRKDEGRGNRYSLYSYFVNNGYIVARVDIRGTGRSGGKLVDGEYSEQEQTDGEQVIDWLSKQSFSSGKIGMFGISWGGFNSLHLAMRHPPALKTIISLMSTDDIYQDDVHFIDGMMHVDAYEIGRDLENALPGAPDFVIDEQYYEDRFETEPWLLKYKRQQTDGPFWDRASLNEDHTQIDIPTFVIGGWYDGYRDFVPRMMKNADVPIKAILGPWNHTWPNLASPGPAIEWRQMAVRWLDHWLKGVDTGILEEPMLYYYQRDYHEPGFDLSYIPGSWKQSDAWPETRDSLFYFHENHRLAFSPSTFKHELEYKPSVGTEASGSVMWWGDWAPDQRGADIYSLVYDSEPIASDMQIIGFPEVNLQASSNAAAANWIVRLSDIAPDGMITQVTGAGFNGTHARSDTRPEAVVKDSIYDLKIELHATSWTFRKGHKIRIAINNGQWPMIWPSPFSMTTAIHSDVSAPSFLKLPVPDKAVKAISHPFPDPQRDPKLPHYKNVASETLSGYAEIKEIKRNERTQTTTVLATNSGSDQYPWGVIHYSEEITHEVSDNTPAEAIVNSTYTITVEKEDRILKLTGVLIFSSDEETYFYDYTRKLEENNELIRTKNWKAKIPRL